MKHFFTLLTLLLVALQSLAQAPSQFSYQAVIRDKLNSVVARKDVAIKVSILQGSETGTPVYEETHRPTTNDNGLITLIIGGGTVVSGVFAKIEWPVGRFFLKTEIDPDANDNVNTIITATSRLLSVPYANYARRSDSTRIATYAESAGGHQMGDLYGGGIIFSLWRDQKGVQHGLIASLKDVGSAEWATPDLDAGTAISVTDGQANTAAIVGLRGLGNAAGLCDSYVVLNGNQPPYSDWYLPSVAELNMLYSQAPLIDLVLKNDNNPDSYGFTGPAYWSSTNLEKRDGRALVLFYTADSGPPEFADKGHSFVIKVRAIRRF
ncbi:hypothetical protein [Hymenobacter psychrophilus]|uniref:DUF1566 domain-containing protein n=1 Tax=Hymenobacter psychrophilus TaxID=651662 RepID=A0A1H3LVX6_9BACT|nr:hypothetical protein [Hymenobacter psychrophilus]SDY68179.1 hypothetical protein SAMN04488069_111144 [Hymenobacter psychrophilus]